MFWQTVSPLLHYLPPLPLQYSAVLLHVYSDLPPPSPQYNTHSLRFHSLPHSSEKHRESTEYAGAVGFNGKKNGWAVKQDTFAARGYRDDREEVHSASNRYVCAHVCLHV